MAPIRTPAVRSTGPVAVLTRATPAARSSFSVGAPGRSMMFTGARSSAASSRGNSPCAAWLRLSSRFTPAAPAPMRARTCSASPAEVVLNPLSKSTVNGTDSTRAIRPVVARNSFHGTRARSERPTRWGGRASPRGAWIGMRPRHGETQMSSYNPLPQHGRRNSKRGARPVPAVDRTDGVRERHDLRLRGLRLCYLVPSAARSRAVQICASRQTLRRCSRISCSPSLSRAFILAPKSASSAASLSKLST